MVKGMSVNQVGSDFHPVEDRKTTNDMCIFIQFNSPNNETHAKYIKIRISRNRSYQTQTTEKNKSERGFTDLVNQTAHIVVEKRVRKTPFTIEKTI